MSEGKQVRRSRRTGYEAAMNDWDDFRNGCVLGPFGIDVTGMDALDGTSRNKEKGRRLSELTEMTPALLWALEVAEMTRLCNNRPVKRYAR